MVSNKNKPRKKTSGKRNGFSFLPPEVLPKILGIVFWLMALVLVLSFIEKAGVGGGYLKNSAVFLLGQGVFALPFIFLLAGAILLKIKHGPGTEHRHFLRSALFATILILAGSVGFLGGINPELKLGGWMGYLVSWPIFALFGFWVTQIVFGAIMAVSFLIFWQLLRPQVESWLAETQPTKEQAGKISEAKENQVVLKPVSSEEKRGLFGKLRSDGRQGPKKEKILQEFQKEKPRAKTKERKLVYPLSLLSHDQKLMEAGDVEARKRIIQSTLDNFDIKVEMGEVNIGPTVAQYTLKPAEGIKLSKITALTNNLALALAAHPLRIEAPIPGKSLVGIEVPNKTRAEVKLGSTLSLNDFQLAGELTVVLGQDVSGKPVFANLAKMPHLLVAGATGSGKTIFLNALILSLLQKNTPETLRFILVDPKRVELHVYGTIPHLLGEVVVEPDKAIAAISWLIKEMENRFRVLAQSGTRDIHSYNDRMKSKTGSWNDGREALPYIVFIIDELADLMVSRGKELEAGIVRLAQMSRAVGIHLVLATQRPSVEVLTGLIKANITCRVALKVATQVDSRTILDTGGAEKLLGAGDALFISAANPQPRRIQSPYISEKEVRAVAEWLSKQERLYQYNNLKVSFEEALGQESSPDSFGGFGIDSSGDELYKQAKEVILRSKKASASLLQRRLRIGYARAARLLDMLEQEGIIGPQEGSKPRKVYYDRFDVEQEEI